MMMKKVMILLVVVLAILALSACGGSTEPAASGADAGAANEVQTTVLENVRLSDGYADALPVQTQLALGTLQLEDTDLAIDETLAAELLPFWRAVQSLGNSDTAAEAEVQAVINQIQDTMAPEQIAAITGMQLTEESLSSMIEDGTLALGGFGRGSAGEGTDSGGGFIRGSDLPGGGPGGGGGIPGSGPGGGGSADLSEDDIATRRAEFAEGGFAGFQDRALTGSVVRLLEVKTGELDETELQAGGRFNPFVIVSETMGISVEALQDAMADGATLGEAVTALGGDLEAVKAALSDVYSELPDSEGQDVNQLIEDALNRSLAFPSGEG
jgi:hypothetical protein